MLAGTFTLSPLKIVVVEKDDPLQNNFSVLVEFPGLPNLYPTFSDIQFLGKQQNEALLGFHNRIPASWDRSKVVMIIQYLR